ncbi:MAG: hypothetical protein U1E75_00110 [Alicycliphilus sp.]
MAASLLSQSRGGWLALGLVFPVLLLQVRQVRPRLFGRVLVLSLVSVAAVVAVLAFTPRLNARVAVAVTEVGSYLATGDGSTSLGTRLDQYRLAARHDSAKTLAGLGCAWLCARNGAHGGQRPVCARASLLPGDPQHLSGYMGQGRPPRRAAAGRVVCLRAVPVLAQRLGACGNGRRSSSGWHDALALRTMGSLVPVCYLVFGMSQPFFNHNSGIMFFVFYVAVLWTALRGLERGLGPQQAKSVPYDLAQHPGAGLQRRALSGGMPGLGGRAAAEGWRR